MSNPAPVIFLVLIFAVLLASIIPAIVITLLMRAVFRRRVSFWMVLLGAVLASVIATAAYVGLLFLSGDGLAALQAGAEPPPMQAVALAVGSFILQLLIMAVVVPDENMELIPISRWLVVLLLQYVVYLLAVLIIALLMMQFAGPSQAMLYSG